jgi:DNA-binding NtrC family response regulator
MSLKNKIESLEKEEIINALKKCNWIKVRAARSLGITERMIGYKIKKYKIRIEKGDDENADYSSGTKKSNYSLSVNVAIKN